MNRKPVVVVRKLLQAAVRRRILILVPFAVMAVASVVAAIMIPKTYMATTLLLLQESGRGAVLQDPNGLVHDRIQERVAGLQALLQSDRVLRDAVLNSDPEAADDPKWLADQLDNLRRSLRLELVGTDFLELQLRAGFAEGLSRKLQAVATSFLESLMPDQRGTTAIQLIAARRQQEIAKTQALVERLRTEMATNQPDDAADDRKLKLDLKQAEELLAAEREDYAVLSRRAAVSDGLRSASMLNAPERILVIDAPEDPKSPLVSRQVFALSGLLAGVLLGVALAVAAEMMDPVIRYEDDLVELARLPLLASFPAAVRPAPPAVPAREPAFRRGPWLAAPAAGAAALVLLVISGSHALGQTAPGGLCTSESRAGPSRCVVGSGFPPHGQPVSNVGSDRPRLIPHAFDG